MSVGHRPTSLDEAVRIMADPDARAVAVAGCTDLLVVDHALGRRHASVVDLLRLPELRGVREDNDVIDVGAACSFTELRRHPLVRSHLPSLAAAAATIGGWQIQNRATIGGNIANASPAGDALPVLLALDARLLLHGPHGPREIPYDTFHSGYRTTVLQPGELIVRVRIPRPAPTVLQAFKKVGTREAQAISKVVVAMRADPTDGTLSDVRVAAGSVAATPVRLRRTETVLEGRPPNTSTADAAAVACRSEVQPLDDVRSTARYRSWVLGNVVRRMVLGMLHDAPEA